jgi:hypothetical protein
VPDEGEEEPLPIAEVQVESLTRDARALGDLLELESGTALDQDLLSDLDDALACIGIAVGASAST